MQQLKPVAMMIAFFFTLALGLQSCSSTSILKVRYQLPQPATALQGRHVLLSVQDKRTRQAVLSPSARNELKNFSGYYSLSVARQKEETRLPEAFDLPELLRTIFKQRLENTGLAVAFAPEKTVATETEIQIDLLQFKLDLQAHKWIFTMSYRARLKKQQKTLAAETVSGSAERLKVIGARDAENVLGGLITDVVNRLDVAKLFTEAEQ